MDDENLSGLDLAAAKDYILAYAVDAKRLDKDIAAEKAELERWQGRITLAEGKSMAALAQAARSKAEESTAKIASLEAERAQLGSKIERMREQLPMIKARERSIDPDRLLAELQMMTGELLGSSAEPGPGEGTRNAAATEADFAALESAAKVDSELDALKRKASGEGA